MPQVRIGIDVGGTFTDAVALDDVTHELLGQVKVPTTHSAAQGVAAGIVEALRSLMSSVGIAPEDVRFIAHGTTQATNALLEGDVAKVGIVATGSGVEGMRARSETTLEDVELAPGRFLHSESTFADSGALNDHVGRAIEGHKTGGASVIVAAAPFSVDDPSLELAIMAAADAAGIPSVGTHQLTKLYGLRLRTRTAVVNACILPRMVETADSTMASVAESGITAPLMVMRGDGGVMTVDEMRRRPVLTVLSGPAAGVAGALLYEKISRGIFLEVGGTSTDMSAVRDGRVMEDYAEIGGHKTYISSLDVRTIGVAGGSMVRLTGSRKLVDVGPRSAHIAGLPYVCFSDPSELNGLTPELIAPTPGDNPEYVCLLNKSGKRFALTTACAANLLGYTNPGDYAHGSPESALLGFELLAYTLGISATDAATMVLDAAARKLSPVVDALLKQYDLDKSSAQLVGGGGGAAAIVPYLAKSMGMQGRVASSHEVISPIGVALAMVREVVERTILSPAPDDLLAVKREAIDAAIRSGASAANIQVTVEIDSAKNLVRVIAVGATEMVTHNTSVSEMSETDLRAKAAEDAGVGDAELIAHVGRWYVFRTEKVEGKLFWKKTRRQSLVLNQEGITVLRREHTEIERSDVSGWREALDRALTRGTRYGDAGATLPETFLLFGSRMVDLSGMHTQDQIRSLAESELSGADPAEEIAILYSCR